MCIFSQFVYNLIICYYVIRPFKLQILFFMHLTNIQYSKFSSSEPLAKVLSLLQFTSRLVSDSVSALFVHVLSNQGQKFNYNFKVILWTFLFKPEYIIWSHLNATFKRFINIILIQKTYKSIRIQASFIFSFLLTLTPHQHSDSSIQAEMLKIQPSQILNKNETDSVLYLGVEAVGEDYRKLRSSYPCELFSSR